jgi:uncharacterized caspase-like protein
MPFPGHALLIGVGRYAANARFNVPKTSTDAELLAQALRDPDLCGYPPDRVSVLTNEAATRARILAALDWLVQDVKPDETVFVFYGGHGTYTNAAKKRYYLTCHDTQLTELCYVKKADSAISEQELLERLNALASRRVLLFFNACHSGELGPQALGPEDEPAEVETLGYTVPAQVTDALLSTGEGRVVITACRDQQRSYLGRESKLTIFGQSLQEGLQGQGTPSQASCVTVFDLYSYLYTTVRAAA